MAASFHSTARGFKRDAGMLGDTIGAATLVRATSEGNPEPVGPQVVRNGRLVT